MMGKEKGHVNLRKKTMFYSVTDPGSGAFLTTGSGIGEKSVSGSGMNNPDHIFGIFGMRDGKNSDPG
jgi:hypothetical protein